jgi:hypothetical protein
MASWLTIDEATLRQIDAEALKQCKGDAVLWFHRRAILEGEYRIKCKGEKAWKTWMRIRNLPQFAVAESSVVEGWRKFVANTIGLPIAQQRDSLAVNRAIIFNACRNARDKQQVAEILKQRADSIRQVAAGGDVRFFIRLGRVLSAPRCPSSMAHEYSYANLSHWLTSHLWLMPERAASGCVAEWQGRKIKTVRELGMELERFRKAKRAYGLRSHKPTLINHITPDGALILTRQGRAFFA